VGSLWPLYCQFIILNVQWKDFENRSTFDTVTYDKKSVLVFFGSGTNPTSLHVGVIDLLAQQSLRSRIMKYFEPLSNQWTLSVQHAISKDTCGAKTYRRLLSGSLRSVFERMLFVSYANHIKQAAELLKPPLKSAQIHVAEWSYWA